MGREIRLSVGGSAGRDGQRSVADAPRRDGQLSVAAGWGSAGQLSVEVSGVRRDARVSAGSVLEFLDRAAARRAVRRRGAGAGVGSGSVPAMDWETQDGPPPGFDRAARSEFGSGVV
ncbi:hypothetical protein [Kribbella sp. NPDC055071]